MPKDILMERITVSVSDACCLVGIGRTKLYELLKNKQIQTVKIGRRTLVKVSSLQALVGAHEVV
jgi:excisionase family DNA binding protein